ncbi:YbaB/EbfC family nucleoid-associated protein [Amycolatopsis echigonensis]|uniref:YbaB/EbfC family nucleoid-associated protein n=1 Tax=Amycolatopsis echigonensis TaxID=2576905 RepID=A0A8E1W833_9PSEU|nr:YbaB/EbfC family nucleoid-associated protein [Amycolatopsis echigonensis]MBB2505318.1 YbaB/EbfC family nucleoid-associated protein [Amycolatopsis echigonensis]
MTDPLSGGDAAARVDQMVAQAKQKAQRYQAMQAAVGQVAVTETGKDGLVTVTVDSAGNVTDLRITDQVRELSGAQVAAAVLTTLRRAQSRLPDRLGEVMAETIGDDRQTVDTIVGNYRAKFPEPEPEEPEPAESQHVRNLGAIEEEPAPKPPRARRPPGGSDEDEDGFGHSFMTRG